MTGSEISPVPAKRQKLAPSKDPLDELSFIYDKMMSYYTFLSTRKHIIPSFDLLRPPVEKSIGRSLTHEDIAHLKYIAPNDIVFEYVDPDQFILEDKHFSWKDGFQQKDLDIYDIKDNTKHEQILIVEFIDGDLSKSKASTGFNSNMKLPQYSAESIKKLILKRQKKFAKLLLEFKNDHPLDSWEIILQESPQFLPSKIDLFNPIDQMNDEVINSEHKPINQVISMIKGKPFYESQFSNDFVIPAKDTRFSQLEYFPLDDRIWQLLNNQGIKKLYLHQALGLDALARGKHVISTTPTSSGKSLIYQLPILQNLLLDPTATAILLFPTKALSQDQLRMLETMADDLNINKDYIATFDGDTESNMRNWVNHNANVLLTNPDTLHMTLIPQHEKWARMLRNLRYVVVDELHAYKGTFGAHVALILRRLRRACELVGNYHVQFIGSSATLKDAETHFGMMIGVQEVKDENEPEANPMPAVDGKNSVATIDEQTNVDDQHNNKDGPIVWINSVDDGSPCGPRHLLGWTPTESSSMVTDTAKLIIELARSQVRTIVFCSIRKTVELVMKEVRLKLKHDLDLAKTIMSYRGGYSAKDRRRIERRMFSGTLNCIVATNALEVGIDIGGLDVVLMCGFPVSLSSFEQQMGRAGRRGMDSLCLLVAGNDPVSRHYVNKMDTLVTTNQWDDLCVDLKNLLVLIGQLQCFLKESPVRNDDLGHEWLNWFNFLEWGIFESLVREKCKWDIDIDRWTCSDDYLPYPSSHISIRNIEEESYAIVDTTGDDGKQEIIEQVETSRMQFTIYEGGIFIHQGLPYIVREVNTDDKYAIVQRTNVDWTTSQRDFTDVDPMLIERIRVLSNGTNVFFGNILKTSIVFGFFKVNSQGKILDAIEVNSKPIKYQSKGVWIDLSKETIDMILDHKLNIPGTIHAIQHAIMNMIPKTVSIGSKDEIQCECKAPEKEFAQRESKRKRPSRIILFDNKGGKFGCGLSSKLFEMIDTILRETLTTIEKCSCAYGCPECCAGTMCMENSLVLSKFGAIVALRCILGISNPLKDVPMGPEPNMPDIAIETCIPCAEFGTVPISNLVEIEEDVIGPKLEPKDELCWALFFATQICKRYNSMIWIRRVTVLLIFIESHVRYRWQYVTAKITKPGFY